MAAPAQDGFFELDFNAEQTQVFLKVYPSKGSGKPVAAGDVVTRLRQLGVAQGIREAEIARAIAHVQSEGKVLPRVVAAQGTLPTEGTDAQIEWLVDSMEAAGPIPSTEIGAPDYFGVPEGRIVAVGQTLATIKPSIPGSPGKSVVTPFRSVPPPTPRELPYSVGTGVRVSADRLHFVAETPGILEIANNQIRIHPLQWVEGGLNGGTHEFACNVAIRGDATACSIRAQGTIAIQGTVAGCALRAKGSIVINRCARSRIVADGDVFISGKLLHSNVVTRARMTTGQESQIAGGEITATGGIIAGTVGSGAGDPTLIGAFDRYTQLRQQEVDAEIARHEESIKRIARGLRPLHGANIEGGSDQRRQLEQVLNIQRRNLEQLVRDLHSEKRTLIMASKTRVNSEIEIRGTIFRGVTVQIDAAAATVDSERSAVRFCLDSFRDSLSLKPLEAAFAA
jgi:uncharacterized protein